MEKILVNLGKASVATMEDVGSANKDSPTSAPFERKDASVID